MSEYQRYEFMTSDRPLTRAQLDAVDDLSSHIEVTSTQAIVEYHHGDFKHDPIDVLYKFFDGFLYFANWGSTQLAFRFPHGILPADLINDYNFDDTVAFTRHRDYDILDIDFNEVSGYDGYAGWREGDLGSLMPLRDELMNGDLRALYIAWLAQQEAMGDYGDDEEEEEEEEEENGKDDEDDGDKISPPPVPPGLDKLTEAQQALADLWEVPQEILVAAAQHSSGSMPVDADDDFVTWINELPQARRSSYLLRLAQNEPGLSHLLVNELRRLHADTTTTKQSLGERVSYATLVAESELIAARLEQEQREREQQAHLRRLQEVHDHQADYWRQIQQAVTRKTSSGYDEATGLLVEMREAAEHFQELQAFRERFQAWIPSHMRRPAFLKRLTDRGFAWPGA
jgi:hypothetical protein